MPEHTTPDGQVSSHHSIATLKKRAKALLKHGQAGDADALQRINAQRSGLLTPEELKLAHAQLAVAREAGFASWPKLSAALQEHTGEEVDFVMPGVLPAIPLRDMVLLPGADVPIFIARERSFKAVEAALEGNKMLFGCTQSAPGIDDVTPEDMNVHGCVATIQEVVRATSDAIRIMVRPRRFATAVRFDASGPYVAAELAAASAEDAGNQDAMIAELRQACLDMATTFTCSQTVVDAMRMEADADVLAGIAAHNLCCEIGDQLRVNSAETTRERMHVATEIIRRLAADLKNVDLSAFAGAYQAAPDFTVDVSIDEDVLIVDTPWDRRLVRPTGKDTFHTFEHDAVPKRNRRRGQQCMERLGKIGYRFIRSGTGQVTGLVRHDMAGDWPVAKKIDASANLPPAHEVFAGRYEQAPGRERLVSAHQGQLLCDGNVLTRVAPMDYSANDNRDRISFKLNAEGAVVGMRYRSGGYLNHYYRMG